MYMIIRSGWGPGRRRRDPTPNDNSLITSMRYTASAQGSQLGADLQYKGFERRSKEAFRIGAAGRGGADTLPLHNVLPAI